MEGKGVRDLMVVPTKYGTGYESYDRQGIPTQSDCTGPSPKSMHISVRDSLKKLRTDYIGIQYVHW
jgi:aryl-alcohol dehydrogenase-like predicted oxidoreductase